MASKYKERLSAMKGAWESSQGAYDQIFGGMKVPAGLYQARLQSAKLTESKTSGKLMIRREHLITEGQYKGMIAWDNMMLETPNGLVYVRRWIELMGYECPSVNDFEEQLEATIEAIVDEAPDVKIQVIHDGDFVNVSVAELLGSNTAPAAKTSTETDSFQGVAQSTLLSFATAYGVEMTGKENAASLVSILSQYEWKKESLKPEEVDMLTAVGVEVIGVEAPEEDTELKNRLTSFCTAQDIKYEEDDDVDMLKERMNGFTYPEDTLTDDEKELLKEIGQEGNIVKSSPPPPPPRSEKGCTSQEGRTYSGRPFNQKGSTQEKIGCSGYECVFSQVVRDALVIHDSPISRGRVLEFMQVCSYDVETTGLSPYKGAEVFSYCIGYEDGRVSIHRLDRGNRDVSLKILQRFFDDTSIAKVCHNTKFDMKHTRFLGIKIPKETVWHDTMIMSQLLRNLAPSHALDYLCWELAGYPRDLDVEVRKRGKEYNGYQNIPEFLMNAYQKADGERTMMLFKLWFEDYIRKDPRIYPDYLNEIELIKTIDHMEDYGINLSQPHVDTLKKWMEDELERVQFEVISQFGEAINLNSEEQVAALLYRRLKLPILEYTESKKPATGKDILLKLRENHPEQNAVYDLIFKQRSYTKGLAIIRGYEEHSDEKKIIHPNIKSNEAVTGRLACENPNLMNVSKEKVLKNPFPVPSRRAFRARLGYLMYFVDYIGIELRLGIEIAKSSKMINLMKEGRHPHIEAAQLFYRERFKSKEENKDLYDAAKNAHFALMYGAGLAQFAATLNLPIAEAKIGYQNYERAFPEIAHLTNTISKKIIADGYIDTPFGRRLTVSRSKAYSGLNYLIQGTAAGILKRALVRVDSYLRENWENKIRLVLPIHDEIVISYPRTSLKYHSQVLSEISFIMIDMKEINVPLEVEWKMTTTTWDQAKGIEIDYRRTRD